MKKTVHAFSSLFAIYSLMLISSGCYYDVASTLYGESENCDTLNVSYAQDVEPIINTYCINCHGGVTPQSGLSLESHSTVSVAASSGPLIHLINLPSTDSDKMPPNDNLTLCQVKLITAWANQGAKNN